MELDRILRVLNVRFATYIYPLLTFDLQTGTMAGAPTFGARNDATDTHAILPYTHHIASGAHPIVPDDHRESDTGPKVGNDGLHADTAISNIHRDMPTGRGGREGKDRAVSVTHLCYGHHELTFAIA